LQFFATPDASPPCFAFFRTQSSYKDNNKTFPYAMQRRELGLAGVTQYGSALQHAAAELRGDREFVLVAVK
jgi:hypothetical protein